MKYTDNELMDYLKRWINTDLYCDLAIAESRGLLLIMVENMKTSGAIDPNFCYEEYKDIETAIVNYKYTKEELESEYKEFHKNLEVWIDPSTNVHAFIPVNCDYTDYFLNQSELIEQGYTFDSGHDSEGKQYKKSKLEK